MSKNTHLSFSQREGKESLPTPMKLGNLSTKFRNLVWFTIDKEISRSTRISTDSLLNTEKYYSENSFIDKIIYKYSFDICQFPHDEISKNPSAQADFIRAIILEEPYDKVLTLVEYIIRHPICDDMLKSSLCGLFQPGLIAYSVQKIDDMLTIVPYVSEEVGEAVLQSLQTIEDKGSAGAKTHLRTATKFINAGDYANAVRESICAVESIACTISPEANNQLKPALDALARAGVLNHPALQNALIKLYGYTSDESGIRHALLNKDTANIDVDDAVFMFGACANFSAYLVNRWENANSPPPKHS